jgi:hypothetical protein
MYTQSVSVPELMVCEMKIVNNVNQVNWLIYISVPMRMKALGGHVSGAWLIYHYVHLNVT